MLTTESLPMLRDVAAIVAIVLGIVSILTTVVLLTRFISRGAEKVETLTGAIERLTGALERGLEHVHKRIDSQEGSINWLDRRTTRVETHNGLDPLPK